MLSAASGCVDTVSYLGLGYVFTANMTGNTVLLGIALGQANEEQALGVGVALAGFVLGVAGGAVITGRRLEGRSVWPRAVTASLACELVVMFAFAVGFYLAGGSPDGGARYLLIALSAVALGTQSTAVRSLGVGGVTSTYVTGTITDVTERAVSRVRWALSSTEGGDESAKRASTSIRDLTIPAYVWVAYCLGAIVGGAAMLRYPSGTVFVPVVLVALVVVGAPLRFGR